MGIGRPDLQFLGYTQKRLQFPFQGEGKAINKLKGPKAFSYNVWWYKNVGLHYLPWANAYLDCGGNSMSMSQVFVLWTESQNTLGVLSPQPSTSRKKFWYHTTDRFHFFHSSSSQGVPRIYPIDRWDGGPVTLRVLSVRTRLAAGYHLLTSWNWKTVGIIWFFLGK